ncbi:hypothetical protein [Candidatus Chloroploca sp. Khr17]|uniref:hypothetical protein n=1 Tax=Candidatus Chloroploca sp. Khr17 TaxID=2496869 RepID=UPI00196B19E4|nr:hypothetical protein [Candidatus Chloroploca sp. Khr17]
MIVYLLHFETPLGNPDNPRAMASHYIGWAHDLAGRMRDHRSGHGAALTRAANERGISYQVVATWPGDRALERWIKLRKCAPRLCPICAQAHPLGPFTIRLPVPDLVQVQSYDRVECPF